MKLGRNDPCWCGSSKKFKRCHLDRDRLTPSSIQDTLDRQKDASSLRVCLAKEFDCEPCSGTIVKAHSLSRKASLERISRNHHLYGFRGTLTEFRNGAGVIRPRLVGIREASTFSGFCSRHDDFLFKKIDTEPLVPSLQQLGLLAYRALCREIIGKMVLGRTVPVMRETDRGKMPLHQLRTQHTANEFFNHVSQTLPDLLRQQKEWHNAVTAASCANLSYALIRFASEPEVICSGVSQPDKDFMGRMLLDLKKPTARQDNVAFALVPAETGGFAFFGWLGHFPEAEEFISSLLELPQSRIPDQLVRYAFETFDSTWLSPEWWEALGSPEQEFLIERFNTGGLPYEAGTSDPYSLRDNGMEFVHWEILGVESAFK